MTHVVTGDVLSSAQVNNPRPAAPPREDLRLDKRHRYTGDQAHGQIQAESVQKYNYLCAWRASVRSSR